MSKKSIAISLGDVNGIGIQLALENHKYIKSICKPVYCINASLLNKAAKKLNMKVPKDLILVECGESFNIKPGQVSKKSGKFSYDSFLAAIQLAKDKYVNGICTLPINKESWNKAGIHYVGHTDMLRYFFKKDAIMMLGCDEMFVALFTEHIPLKEVAKNIQFKKLYTFFHDFYKSEKVNKIAVLGLNPHAGDNGVLGNEEKVIIKAIKAVNKDLIKEVFFGPIVPDTAFSPKFRKNNTHFIAMYHDQGLAPLKALYFDRSINVSLNLPIKRTSVDHGTAFDIAYKNTSISNESYMNAVKKLL